MSDNNTQDAIAKRTHEIVAAGEVTRHADAERQARDEAAEAERAEGLADQQAAIDGERAEANALKVAADAELRAALAVLIKAGNYQADLAQIAQRLDRRAVAIGLPSTYPPCRVDGKALGIPTSAVLHTIFEIRVSGETYRRPWPAPPPGPNMAQQAAAASTFRALASGPATLQIEPAQEE